MSILDPKSGTVAGVLPCGYLDPDGKLHSDFIVREMTGEEEDVLAGKGPVITRLNRVILNCLDSLGGETDKTTLNRAVAQLTAVDRMLLMISIRRASLGDQYMMKITCQSQDCQDVSTASLNLAHLEVKPMEEPACREFETTLASGRLVKWHVMDGRDEQWLQGMAKKGQNILTLSMLSRVDGVDDLTLNRQSNLAGALKCLKAFRMSERNELRALFVKCEGSVDTEVEYECPSCGHEFKSELDVGQQTFFFPAGM